ncbi:MAG: ABC transporter substrate-binding protein [bacterium]
MRKILFITIVIFVLFCSMQMAAYAQESVGPKRGGTLRIAALAAPPRYDAHSGTSMTIQTHTAAVFSGLVRTDPMKDEVSIENMIPDLAERWEISPDGKIYTFYLRKGVKFHDGHPFTAKDIKYSLDKYRDKARSAFAGNVSAIDNIEIVNDYLLKIYLKYAYPDIILFLSPPYCSIGCTPHITC